MLNAKTEEEILEIIDAWFDLREMCDDKCLITHEPNIGILKKHELIDSNNQVEKEICEIIKAIEKDPSIVRIKH
jgi:hypothetical protein